MTAVLSIKSSPIAQNGAAGMCVSEAYESHIEIAVDVFKARDRASLQSLKDFLTVLPTPKCIEEVLAEAIYRLVETDPDASRWLLQNPSYLMPELDLVEWVRQSAFCMLQEQGFEPSQDFRLEADGRLYFSERAKAELRVGNSAQHCVSIPRLLLEEVLQGN